ncbi:A-kinase anchor protein 1, mitochondrial [Manis javanica]|uniref:A-kinase anchor protein 1, mitochondrial n=1 Tax=Manis javanica TaxID=9974 RepID=UPI000813D87A|nr:A-kinase anchor protein 1, mitochondrial [Manis javanica]XP_036854962.1 A-kinase anchor protein 1, mitochondrial [Manis javanica]
MAIQFRSFFPLVLPGMLALLGWWWFFSRKKEDDSRHDTQLKASAGEQKAHPAIKETLPMENACPVEGPTSPSVTQLPEKELSSVSKPCGEPLTLLQAHPACHRSESSGNLPNTTDTRFRPGMRKDDSAKMELALMGDDVRSYPPECPLPSPKGVAFPHEAVEMCKLESMFWMDRQGQQGQCATLAEKHGPQEKAREMGGAEGTGEAVLGDTVLEEGVLFQERGSELQNSKVPSLAFLEGGGEKRESGPPQVEEAGGTVGELSSTSVESAPPELEKENERSAPQAGGGRVWDRDFTGELGQEEALNKNENIQKVAFQIISKVILEATEEVLATTMGKIAGRMYQTSAGQFQGRKEESCALLVSQNTALGQRAEEAAMEAAAEATTAPSATALPLPGLPPGCPPPPKTYMNCLTSPLSSPTKDKKPKNSACHISLARCPTPAALMGESLDQASVLVEDVGYDDSQGVPSMASCGQCSDSVSTSGLEDSCTETSSSSRDKASTPPLSESTVPFSNGVLKGELSDLGTEDGWTVDAEVDHSGGSDGNSMDSVEGCCGLRKTDGFQNAQAGSSPKKVDLIIWEIEVPKHLVGRLIGKQGRYVSFLKQTSGAKIYISTLPYTQNIQICHIEGSQRHVDKALNLIGKKFKELNLTNIYAPPLPSLALPSLPMTSWLMLPDGITVEVVVVNQVNAGHLFVQQHTHPTFHALRSLDQQMFLCYSQPGIPTLPTPVEITVICAAPGMDGAWWRAQVVASYEETDEVEIRYVDYGGYKRVKVDVLRQIRSDFVTLPFQGAEVLLDSVMPLSDNDQFSPEADAAMSEMTGNAALLAQVTSYSPTGLPLIQLWSVIGDEVVLINRSLVERGLAQWVDSYYVSL